MQDHVPIVRKYQHGAKPARFPNLRNFRDYDSSLTEALHRARKFFKGEVLAQV